MNNKTSLYPSAKRVVVKIGSSSVTDVNFEINYSFISRIAREIAELKKLGHEVILVSSGAISAGMGVLSISKRPTDASTLQACASCGQVELVHAWNDAFTKVGITLGQTLFTRNDTSSRQAYLHTKNTLQTLIDLGCVPLINENDTVSIGQIRFGDNDTLAALAAAMGEADLTVLLSDVDGLYTSDPSKNSNAELISEVRGVNDHIRKIATPDSRSAVGTGGMLTKVRAARILGFGGIPLVVCKADKKGAILKAAQGQRVGTRFLPTKYHTRTTARKLWIALGGHVQGSVVIDKGAEEALLYEGASLLPVGVTEVIGSFIAESAIDVLSEEGVVIGRGLSYYNSSEISSIKGMSLDKVAQNLTYKNAEPIVHRDELLIF